MERKEALEVLKGEIIKFEGTRNTQWKFNISVWTLLSLAIFSKSDLSMNDIWCMAVGFATIIIHTLFLVQIQYSLECSKKLRELVHNFLNSTEGSGNIPAGIKLGRKVLFEQTHFRLWVFIQISITFLLSSIFIFKPTV